MTKPVVVENVEQAPGVLHVDPKAWTKGPCGNAPEPQADSAALEPEQEDAAPPK